MKILPSDRHNDSDGDYNAPRYGEMDTDDLRDYLSQDPHVPPLPTKLAESRWIGSNLGDELGLTLQFKTNGTMVSF